MLHRPDKHHDASTSSRGWLPPLSSTSVATLLVGLDTLSILGAAYLCYFWVVIYPAYPNELYNAAILFVWLGALMLMHFADLYRFEAAMRPLRAMPAILVAISTSFLFLLAAAFSIKITATFSRLWLGWFALGSMAAVSLMRLMFSVIVTKVIGLRHLNRNVAIIGGGEQARRLVTRLEHSRDRPISIRAVFSDATNELADRSIEKLPSGVEYGGTLPDLIDEIRTGRFDDVMIALPWSEDDRIMEVARQLNELPVNVYLASDLIGFRAHLGEPPGHFGSLPIHQLFGKPISGWDTVLKAVEDYVLASLLLIVLSPLLVVIALAIKIDSPGPFLFRQKRLGFNNERFDVYKFRSMRVEPAAAGRTIQATPDDPRITPLGKFLRRWSLDELPQLLNVLNGTMSLVGPRPHAIDHNEEFAREIRGYFARHKVKPGITGLAQIRGYRGATDTREKLEGRIRNDVDYMENWSLSLDLKILLQTAGVCLTGKNAY